MCLCAMAQIIHDPWSLESLSQLDCSLHYLLRSSEHVVTVYDIKFVGKAFAFGASTVPLARVWIPLGIRSSRYDAKIITLRLERMISKILLIPIVSPTSCG